MAYEKKLSIDELQDVTGGSVWIQPDEAAMCGIELKKEDGTPGEWGCLLEHR